METNEVKENVKSMDSLVLDNTNNFIWLYNTIKTASTTQDIRSIYDNIERDVDKQNLIIGLAYIVEKNKSIISLDIRADMADIINDVSDKLEWGIDFKQRQDSDTQKLYFWGFAVVYPFIKISDTGSSCLIFSEYITDSISTLVDKYPNLDKSLHDVIIDKVNNIDKYLINTKLDGFTNDEEQGQSNENSDCSREQEIKEDNADTNVVDNSNSINSSTITTSLDKPDFTKINEVSKLTASDATNNDLFGVSVSISGDGLQAMIGALYKDINGLTNNGQVYTYTRATVNDPWTEVSKLTASDAASYDWFGRSVSISGDGLQAMIGALYKDTNGLTDNGQVYTYTRPTVNDPWTEVSKLTASDAASTDWFGISVVMSNDGLQAIVGAHGKDTNGLTDSGQVYTYTRATVTDAWTEVSKLTASDAAGDDRFGISVAISEDGLQAMVGAHAKDINGLTNNGQVYTYTRATINDPWTEVSKLTASDAASNDSFGVSVSISGDGLQAMVGAHYKDTNDLNYNGQVYTYTRPTVNDPWTEVSKLTSSDAASGDLFGTSLSISSDGLQAMIGALYKSTNGLTEYGQVYTYNIGQCNKSTTNVDTKEDAVDNAYDIDELLKYFEMFTTVTGAITKEQSISEIAADICINLAKIIANGNMLVITNFNNEELLNIASNSMSIVDMLFKRVIIFNLLSYDYDEQETRADLINYFDQFDGNELEPLYVIKQAIDNRCI